MNMQGAAERADKILDDTFAAIKPPVHWTHGESTEGSCDVSRRRAVMTVISKERRGSFLGVVERYWKSQGHKQIGVNQNANSPAIYFQTSDEFNVRVLIGGNGQAFFEVATPCVGKSSVSPPTSKTVGPNYAGKAIPDPNVHSDFWSPKAPVPSASPSGT
ncbi:MULTISPECIES: hypothetical protein [Streptomyces]|uniref:hypothetical protein n=1 Tax=Streptomyces TaxID=1883 RepID=UPI001164488C|nr:MULTISPECIES: hypothetical protein [unclassified Streptomyces]NMI60275.1 hypothetical protein [Streptomyces sp. RLA2-12]QDN59459.1 hypothetical protein FNV67_32995 [Streptomyces sp. S1D4-20]QDN69535.1 hypothetical protein FNV66_32015 [Streptomyces sp. S1D4-14]QDO52005.1 hypothetical protein FNV60_30600 [Streptomyces sp. RLB3-5]QDO62247.1 hypothetical protein FNV59_32845 [Streptomyces sp. RLB1-8]